MKILIVAMKYDYGDPIRGRSYEYYNFYMTLIAMGHEVELFDFVGIVQQFGRATMNKMLLEKVRTSKPSFTLFSLFRDEFDPECVQKLQDYTKTFCFFHDDTWRKDFSQYWAQYFNFFSSSDFEAFNKYTKLNLKGIYHLPFGANCELFRPIEVKKDYDISFVGSWHPHRQWLIDRLRAAGMSVFVAGYKWPNSTVDHNEMVRIFNASKINLNLSNSASWDARYLVRFPTALARQLKHAKYGEQIKARHFEINACKSFQLSYYVDGLERCYNIGEEIAVFLNPDDLIDKCRYYLSNEELRVRISENGFIRTLGSHTYKSRFNNLFLHIGFAQNDLQHDLEVLS